VLLLARNVQWGLSVLVGRLCLCALVEQDGRDVGVAVESGQVQRSPTAVVGVDVDAVLEQGADCVGLAVADGEVKSVPALNTSL
jgi:hypothetical protein